MLDARESDAQGEPRRDTAQIRAYLRGTSGALMLAAGQATGLTDFEGHHETDQALEGLGEALGIANWLLSQPALKSAGRGHVAPDEDTIRELCEHGLQALEGAYSVLGKDGNAALRSAWRTKPILRQAHKSPAAVVDGALGQSEFLRRGSLLWRSLLGRW